jgi:hypothetical protein
MHGVAVACIAKQSHGEPAVTDILDLAVELAEIASKTTDSRQARG